MKPKIAFLKDFGYNEKGFQAQNVQDHKLTQTPASCVSNK